MFSSPNPFRTTTRRYCWVVSVELCHALWDAMLAMPALLVSLRTPSLSL